MISAARIARRAAEFEYEDAEVADAAPARRFAASLAAHLEADVAGAMSRGEDHYDMNFTALVGAAGAPHEFRDVAVGDLIVEIRVLFYEAGMRTEMVNGLVVRVCDLQRWRGKPRQTSNAGKRRSVTDVFRY
jgi:hypothetical protein